jgi:hypothetical protein
MRLLRINDIDVDIDDQTAIGIDFQSYDVKQPGKNFINISNTFTVPLTANNKAIFGNAENPQSLNTDIYEESICNYWIDNEQLIKNAKCRVDEIQDRISIFIFQKDDIWDILKSIDWADFIPDFITWLQTTKSYPSSSSPFVGAFLDFLTTYSTTTEGVFLPMYFGNFYNYDPPSGAEDSTNIWLKKTEFQEGGHFCIYAKTIFEYIEDTYDVNFLTSGGVLPGNIWDDPFADAIYVPAKELTISFRLITVLIHEIYFEPVTVSSELFNPLSGQRDKKDKTLYDFVNAFMQHFNILKDELEVNGDPVIRLARFDDLETIAEVKDFSGNLSKKPLYQPFIKGYGQQNRIKFKEIFPEGDTLLNSKTLTSLNVNSDYSIDLFDIDSYVPGFIEITGGVVPDLSITESFKTFVFLLSDGLTDDNITVWVNDTGGGTFTALKLQKAALYSLTSEYNFLDDIITYPRYYEVEKWLSLTDLKDFEFFKQYFIRELNGSFFINKISGFNPDKSKEATKLEIIKISDRTPLVDPDLDYWTDGVEDAFTDGEGDYFY